MSNAWGRQVLVVAFTAVCVIAAAQDKTQNKTQGANAPSEQGVASDSREAVKGRLPRYFASLVNSDQRTEIYRIQAKFRDQIAELKQQLEKLESKQMQDIEAVLTTGQREKLNDFRNSSRKKRSKDFTPDESRNSSEAMIDPATQTSNLSD